MTKVIIGAGGRGTRVHVLTGNIIPKPLCRISKRTPHSLIAYQLKKVSEAGFKDVFILFDFDWQIHLFNQLVRIKEVPNLRYTTGTARWEHPLHLFRNRKVIDFIGRDDFVLTYGDLFYSRDILRGMKSLAEKNNTSVASLMYSKNDRWKDAIKKITFSKDDDRRVVEVELTKKGNFIMHPPFFFQNRALETIKEELACDPSETTPLLKRLIKKKQLSVFRPDFLVNMNTPEDIAVMERGILKHAK